MFVVAINENESLFIFTTEIYCKQFSIRHFQFI